MNFYKHHLGDYASSTAHLSLTEHGAYLLMLHHHYATEQPLPLDVATIARIIRATGKSEIDAIKSILRQFWTETETGWVQVRAQEEIEKASAQRDINRETGKRGGRPRKTESVLINETKSETESVLESEPNGNPSQTPDTRHQTKTNGINTHLLEISAPAREQPPADGVCGVSPGDLTRPMVQAGIRCNPGHPDIIALARSGCTPATVQAAIDEAKLSNPTPTQGYVVAILKRWQAAPPPDVGNAPRAPTISAQASKQAHRDSYDAQARAAQERIFGNGQRAEIDITAMAKRIA